MSDQIFQIATAYADVAGLAQGYINRADGERILLPLPEACADGDGVRFVVLLADGTPAFAGAGRCVQQSDQGATVPPAERFETLIDSLHFDERSQPVYDYIVAVRNAAYAQGADAAPDEAAGASDHVEEVLDAEMSVDAGSGEPYATDFGSEDEPTEFRQLDARAADAAARAADASPESDAAGYDAVVTADEYDPGEIHTVDGDEGDAHDDADLMEEPEQVLVEGMAFESPSGYQDAQAAYAQPGAPQPSFVPAPIPTGILTRPALAVHWSPNPARRPTPRPATGLFHYNGQGLPRPAGPPRPDLDPSLWITPAPRPGQAAQQPAYDATAAHGGATAGYDPYATDEESPQASEPPVSVAPGEVEFSDDEDAL